MMDGYDMMPCMLPESPGLQVCRASHGRDVLHQRKEVKRKKGSRRGHGMLIEDLYGRVLRRYSQRRSGGGYVFPMTLQPGGNSGGSLSLKPKPDVAIGHIYIFHQSHTIKVSGMATIAGHIFDDLRWRHQLALFR